MDGKVRKIEVKSDKPGVKVRARKSYAAVKLPPQEAIWGFGKRLRAAHKNGSRAEARVRFRKPEP